MARNEFEEYEERLRSIFLNSADVLPDKVTSYIERVKKSKLWDAIEQIRAEYRPLIENLTKEYVDYFLYSIIKKDDSEEDFYEYSFDDKELGISDLTKFFPASPAQGPFFYLLKQNEDEGLRLIHILTNHAVRSWREREVRWYGNGETLTLIPVRVNLPTHTQEFWGDAQVYGWFRPTYNCPDSVTSALMALEMWMEQQIEAGRDVKELFHKVLSGSECVALPAVCIAMTLAYEDKCLKAALPLITQPAFWNMDIARYTFDLSYGDSMTTFIGFESGYEPHPSILKDRNKRLQRKKEIRHLAVSYLFSEDEQLSNNFAESVSQFAENLPFYCEEEKLFPERVEKIREQIELYQVYGNPENFRFSKTEDGQVWSYVEQPQKIKERQAKEHEELSLKFRWRGLWTWATSSLKDLRISNLTTIEEAFSAANEFQKTDDFTEPIVLSGWSDNRLEGIIGVAATILLLGDDWLKKQPDGGKDIISWCRSMLLKAATVEVEIEFDSRQSNFPIHPKAHAALGFGALVSMNLADEEIRQQLILLAADYHIQVATSVFRGLTEKAWIIDPVLCWNALSLVISVCLVPHPKQNFSLWDSDPNPYESREQREKERINNLINTHLENLTQSAIPTIPKVPFDEEINFLWDLAGVVIQFLPLPELCKNAETKSKLLELNSELLQWTIKINYTEENEREPHIYDQWNQALFNWATKLFKYLTYEEMQKKLFVPLRDNYAKTQKLTADLLKNYAFNRLDSYDPLPDDSVRGWREICSWVLQNNKRTEESNYRRFKNWESLNTVIFISSTGCIWNETWLHVSQFSDLIDEWVNLVGTEPRRFSSLLLLIERLGKYFEPKQIIQWFGRIIKSVEDLDEFWKTNENGYRTANILQILWNKNDQQISKQNVLLTYSTIIDSLVIFGVPLARVLQEKLERNAKD